MSSAIACSMGRRYRGQAPRAARVHAQNPELGLLRPLRLGAAQKRRVPSSNETAMRVGGRRVTDPFYLPENTEHPTRDHIGATPVRTVAALYIDPHGPYPGLPGVDCWDEDRDARGYDGPHPVVAHPPCQLWTNFAALNYKRYGGAHNRPGNDRGCFAAALDCVNRFGGVLEHPAGSYAWLRFGLVVPIGIGWEPSCAGWVCEVWQSAYGHKARKRTWLYYRGPKPVDANWERNAGTHQCGWFDRIKPTLSKAEASRTPPPVRSVARRAGEVG